MATSHVGTALKPILTDADIADYVRANTLYNQYKKERDRLREPLLAALEAGIACPNAGPFIVELTYQDRMILSWKDICLQVVGLLGERLQAKARALIAEAEQDRQSVPQLTVKPNPAWGDR